MRIASVGHVSIQDDTGIEKGDMLIDMDLNDNILFSEYMYMRSQASSD